MNRTPIYQMLCLGLMAGLPLFLSAVGHAQQTAQVPNNAGYASLHHGFFRSSAGWANTIPVSGKQTIQQFESKFITVSGTGMNFQIAGGFLMSADAKGVFRNRPYGYIVGTGAANPSENLSKKKWVKEAERGIFNKNTIGGNYFVTSADRRLVTVDARGTYRVYIDVEVAKGTKLGGNYFISPEGQLTRIDYKGQFCTDFTNNYSDVTSLGGTYLMRGDQIQTIPSTDCFAQDGNGTYKHPMVGSETFSVPNLLVKGGTFVIDSDGNVYGIALDGSIQLAAGVVANAYPELVGFSFVSYRTGENNEYSRLYQINPDGGLNIVTESCGVCAIAIQPEYSFQ